MKYKFIDYWNSGNIDVMLDNEIVAEVDTQDDGFLLCFMVHKKHQNMAALQKWVQEHIKEMASLVFDEDSSQEPANKDELE